MLALANITIPHQKINNIYKSLKANTQLLELTCRDLEILSHKIKNPKDRNEYNIMNQNRTQISRNTTHILKYIIDLRRQIGIILNEIGNTKLEIERNNYIEIIEYRNKQFSEALKLTQLFYVHQLSYDDIDVQLEYAAFVLELAKYDVKMLFNLI